MSPELLINMLSSSSSSSLCPSSSVSFPSLLSFPFCFVIPLFSFSLFSYWVSFLPCLSLVPFHHPSGLCCSTAVHLLMDIPWQIGSLETCSWGSGCLYGQTQGTAASYRIPSLLMLPQFLHMHLTKKEHVTKALVCIYTETILCYQI